MVIIILSLWRVVCRAARDRVQANFVCTCTCTRYIWESIPVWGMGNQFPDFGLREFFDVVFCVVTSSEGG